MAEPQPIDTSTPSPKNLKLLLSLAGVFLVVVGLLALLAAKYSSNTSNNIAAKLALVTITPSGFVPQTLTIPSGTKVTFTNTDTNLHQIQANPHPTGDSLPGLKSQILNNAQTYSYTFTKKGHYGYHDYLVPTTNGIIEVK